MQAKPQTIIAILLLSALTLAQSPQAPQSPHAPEPIEPPQFRLAAQWDESDEFVTTFPTGAPSGVPENDVVPLRLLLPKERQGKLPVVLVLHYWGALNRDVERRVAFQLNRRGVAAALMALPFHLERTPPGARSGDLAIRPDPEYLKTTLFQSLQDARRSLDVLGSHPEIDSSRIGITGLSLGGIVASLTYGVDTRLTHAAFILGGVDLAHILWNSSRVVSQREQLRRDGYTEEKLREAFAELEPEGFLKAREGGTAFVVGARYDTVIPTQSTERLISALHKPKTLWLETGHYGGAFVQGKLLAEVAEFFEREFAGLAYEPPKGLGAPTLRLGVQFNVESGMDIGAGMDLFGFGRRREWAATALLTPRGLQVFFGRRMDRSISLGVSVETRGARLGVLWSTVL